MGTPAPALSVKMRPRSQDFTSRLSTGEARAGMWPMSASPRHHIFTGTNGSNLIPSRGESTNFRFLQDAQDSPRAEREQSSAIQKERKPGSSHPRTGSSNPVPSSRESGANLIFGDESHR